MHVASSTRSRRKIRDAIATKRSKNGMVAMATRGKRVPDISPEKNGPGSAAADETSASNSHIDVEALPRPHGHYAHALRMESSCTVCWGG